MKNTKEIEKQVRGWFPQETKMPLQSSTLRRPRGHKSLPNPVRRILTNAAMYSAVFTLLFAFSTIQTALVVSTAIAGIFWFIVDRTNYKQAAIFLRKSAFCLLGLVLIFACLQFLVFETSGFTITTVPQLSYPSLLNASLTEYLQNVEQSENFRLLQANHLNSATFEKLRICAYPNHGWLTWTFRTTDTNSEVTIGNIEGKPYRTSVGNMMESFFPRIPQTKRYTLQSTVDTFQQIDRIGLASFLKQGVDIYQNRPNASQISALIISIGYNEVGNYQGLTILLSARGENSDEMGTTVYTGLFEAEFEPDGTLLTYKSLS
ncbi:MAG: hypothetical protein NWE96_06145 [Candidatus Bathyarchaeota archaeon]|nr:hypothetical protein [Candidatus Bathyarchaeota archaeon]